MDLLPSKTVTTRKLCEFCDLFGMVSSRAPLKKVVGDLQLGDKKVMAAESPGTRIITLFQWLFLVPLIGGR